ncbi:sulfite exporter TauE/SafE family protein [Amphiplicatus metriothermophilus]|uniref:Probable membrane transporter protein n=1 Tax=Amphiplicatus metriothermophilus TaxID=1519374 RepID=A0A239PY19_9PROT|nr:sulfite exporter TauE/SafE family protein [Amphiplicatus metriothermophilus]MBB5519776.1 putative membrane protein YfcA [Amphiplicatus metriothermophilus]SNT75211.1 Uncharacterized membrane protein YfcA [Amphiplicatus metriothermophilus]
MASFLAAHGFLLLTVLAAGLAAGFAGGLFGIGGGIVTVPALYAVFRAYDVAPEPSLKTAIGTSLAVIIITSLRALRAHHLAGYVDIGVLRAWAPWIAAGAVAGGLTARWIPVEALTVVFTVGALFIAWRRLTGSAPPPPDRTRDLSSKAVHIPMGFGTGLFSSLMGLGGGAVGVMVMAWSGRSMRQAVATASGFGVAVAAPGTAGFIVSGLGAEGLPPLSLGHVNLLAFAAMAAMTAISAPLGARAAHRIDGDLLSRLFGVYVGLAALGLLWEALR